MTNVNVLARRAVRAVATAAVVTALTSGCSAVNWIKNDGVSNPMTPEQSRAEVVDAAREIVSTLNLSVIEPVFWRGSCNDQGEAPFQGRMAMGYPMASSFEASDAEVAAWLQTLQTKGWTTDSDYKTHATAITKNGVTAVFAPQNSGTPTRRLNLYGECRDVTTTKDTRGTNEHVDLTAPA